jgi:hypothetical protein
VATHVNVTFDGKKRRLEVRRDRLAALERDLPDVKGAEEKPQGASSSYACLKRFWAGEWMAADIETILQFAMETVTREQAKTNDLMRRTSLHSLRLGLSGIDAASVMQVTPGDPMPAIRRDGHAAYVELAELLLRAALFGITDDEVDFDARPKEETAHGTD